MSAESHRGHHVIVGEADPDLDQRLSAELDGFNVLATARATPQRELTVRILGEAGDLRAGISGWSWGVAAGIAMTWVSEEARGQGLGGLLLRGFEDEARVRGSAHVFVTSFTFQAPQFYERHGYQEIFRWQDVPLPGQADVHFRKEL